MHRMFSLVEDGGTLKLGTRNIPTSKDIFSGSMPPFLWIISATSRFAFAFGTEVWPQSRSPSGNMSPTGRTIIRWSWQVTAYQAKDRRWSVYVSFMVFIAQGERHRERASGAAKTGLFEDGGFECGVLGAGLWNMSRDQGVFGCFRYQWSMKLNQYESTWINMNQHESTWINMNQHASLVPM